MQERSFEELKTALVRAQQQYRSVQQLQYTAAQMRSAGSFGRLERERVSLEREITALRREIAAGEATS